jgi:hypothetical protein
MFALFANVIASIHAQGLLDLKLNSTCLDTLLSVQGIELATFLHCILYCCFCSLHWFILLL